MAEEFNLSDRIFEWDLGDYNNDLIHLEDVKEFIRLIKLRHCLSLECLHSQIRNNLACIYCLTIDKLAGDKLI